MSYIQRITWLDPGKYSETSLSRAQNPTVSNSNNFLLDSVFHLSRTTFRFPWVFETAGFSLVRKLSHIQCMALQPHDMKPGNEFPAHTLSTQVAPLAHGLDTHSSSSISQLVPVNPGWHTHLYPSAVSTHAASLLQGFEAQSVMAVKQN